MAWTAPQTFVTGTILTASALNTNLRDNLLETAAAKFTTAGDLFVGTGANAGARLAAVAAGQVLTSQGVGVAPAWGVPAARRCLVRLNANQLISTGSTTEILWDDEASDPDGWHSVASNTGRVTPTLAGLYLVTAQIGFAFNATGTRNLAVRKNGALDTAMGDDDVQAVTNTNTPTRVKIVRCFSLNGTTDYVNAYATQSSGGNLNLNGIATIVYCWLEVLYLGA